MRRDVGDLAGRRDLNGLLVMEFGIESQHGECKVGRQGEGWLGIRIGRNFRMTGCRGEGEMGEGMLVKI